MIARNLPPGAAGNQGTLPGPKRRVGQKRIISRAGLATALAVLAALFVTAACSRPPADDAARKARVYELFAQYKKDFPNAPEVSAEDAVSLWRQGKLLPIDVREPTERAVSTLPGAVTAEEYLADPGRFGDKRPVAYCTIGYRSGQWAEAKAREGLPVANMAAGLLGWLHAGGTLVDAKGEPTKTVNVYGRTWDLAPKGYIGVW
ncbi:Rhodanese domain protein [Solidesulfovibrio fructosivorans JJ]]|uniref:Rhodanese domain protein n=1 Tax=Solidesulfovibrio fructosivorans JJ] TaxID=596151 RepID=E1JU54_SOLFR|nr:rhodanese-like domain-containing protein [Solidesulfovibrio fructosivorans]EFL51984.1 Rhodanese domain protein [Solidesulfovibrio fructosivorans JJ]]